MNAAKMTLVSTVLAAAMGLALGLFLIPAPAVSAPPPGPPPGPSPGGGGGDVVSVDCATDTIQAAVNNAVGSTTIFIQGVCDEVVTINKDDVTLSGNQSGSEPGPGGTGTIQGTINIVGGSRVGIEFLTVTGSGNGIVGTQNAAFTIMNSIIEDNDRSGIVVEHSSSAEIKNSIIRRNGVDFVFSVGVRVSESSSAHLTDSEVLNNRNSGLEIARNAAVLMDGNTVQDNGKRPGSPQEDACGIELNRGGAVRLNGGNTISNNTLVGICAGDGTIVRQSPLDTTVDTIDQSAPSLALDLFNGASADFRQVDITGNSSVIVLSTLRVRNPSSLLPGPRPSSSMTGNVSVDFQSGVRIGGTGVTFTGTLSCNNGSFAFFSAVQCGQTCTGAIPGSCSPP